MLKPIGAAFRPVLFPNFPHPAVTSLLRTPSATELMGPSAVVQSIMAPPAYLQELRSASYLRPMAILSMQMVGLGALCRRS